MKVWKVVIGVFLVFALGVLVGLVPPLYFRPSFPPPPPMAPKDRGHFLVNQLTSELSLSHDQQVQVEAIVEQMSRKLDEHFKKVEPEVKGIFNDGFSQIEKVLSEAQKKKLAAMRARMEKQRKERPPMPPPDSERGRHPEPPPGPPPGDGPPGPRPWHP